MFKTRSSRLASVTEPAVHRRLRSLGAAQVTGHVEHIYLADTRRKTMHSTCYSIHLRPTAVLHNLLPVALHVLACGTVTEDRVDAGRSRHLTAVELGTFVVLKVSRRFHFGAAPCRRPTLDSSTTFIDRRFPSFG